MGEFDEQNLEGDELLLTPENKRKISKTESGQKNPIWSLDLITEKTGLVDPFPEAKPDEEED